MIAALVRNRASVQVATACIVIFGLLAYRDLPREAAPDVDIPVVLVVTPYIGVSPEDIESLITIPLEDELADLKDLDTLASTSAEGASMIRLEFTPDVLIEEAIQRVRDRVNRTRPELPPDAEETEVREISFSDWPILLVTIAGPVDEEVLKSLGEDLEDEVSRIPGVLEAELTGGRTRQIRIQVDGVRLAHYKLSLSDVIGAVGDENVNIPGGDVVAGGASFLVRVPGEFDDALALGDVPIKRRGDRPVFVRDVARVVDGFEDRDSYSRMNGEPAVTLSVTKRVGENILDVAQKVKDVTAEHAAKWPKAVRYQVLGDESKWIEDMVSELENGVLTALILVVTVIFFFMGARNSFFVAMAIPLSMLLGLIAISALGLTLNMVVLFSLILALGMLVDNAIVIVENVYRHHEEGADIETAAVTGTNEVATAVIASTATTVVGFCPLLFWPGIMGEFMSYLPLTVILVLIASLVVALGALPVALSRYLRVTPHRRRKKPLGEGPLMRRYKALLEFSIRHRYISAGLGLASLVVTFVAYGFLNHGTEFFPNTEPDRGTISVRMPDGTDLEATDRVARQIERELMTEENVEVFVAQTGTSGGMDLLGPQALPNQASFTMDFLPNLYNAKPGDKVRVEPTPMTIDRIRHRTVEIPGAEIQVEKERMGPPVGSPIAVEVSGDDFHALGAFAAHLRRVLSEIPGVAELGDDYRVGRPELRLRVDRGAAKRVGASTQSVAATVRTAVAGTKASTLRDGADEYDIVVEMDPRQREDLQSVLALRIPGREDTSPDTFAVPLSAVATYELAGGTGSIRRLDQKRVVTISGDVSEGFNENAVRGEVTKVLESAEVPRGIAVRLGGADDEQKKAEAFLSKAFLVAVFLIGLVLVTQFNRLTVPFIIMASVVLSLIGVLWGLVITGMPFGIMMTGVGVISLAGVVVNNAIVLLTYVQQLRARGFDAHRALVVAGMTRFRPVMLTAITTILGLVPMALGISVDFAGLRVLEGGQTTQWWSPMAIAVIFGLALATVLTLVLVPTLYGIAEDMHEWLGRMSAAWRRWRGLAVQEGGE